LGGGLLAQTGTPGTEVPAHPEADGGGPGIGGVLLGIVLFVAVLVLAARFLLGGNPAASPDAQTPTRTPTPSGDAGRAGDVLRHRQEVKELSTITESDTLADIKIKKMEKVSVGSYEEAKKHLEARKAGRVTAAQRRVVEEGKAEDGKAEEGGGLELGALTLGGEPVGEPPQATEEPVKAEPAAEPPKAEEPAKAEPATASEPEKAEEPAKVEAAPEPRRQKNLPRSKNPPRPRPQRSLRRSRLPPSL
jgi:hypothetical protein